MSVKVRMEKAEEHPNMCTGCPGHCCKLTVDLTSYDMYRLAIVEGKAMDSFAHLVYADTDDAYGFKAEGKMVKFVLKHKEDGFCILFDKSKDFMCTVEGSKPAICLAYPFNIVDGKPSLRDDAACPPMNKLLADPVKMSVPVIEDARWEWARYLEFVDDWNLKSKGDEPAEKFLKFAAREMDLEKSPIGRAYRKIKRSLLWKLKGY
jgi:Fe-S-cluster containining protein